MRDNTLYMALRLGVIVIVIVIVVSTEQIGVPATGVILGKLISTPKKN